jgi:hypothetical protein
MVKNIYAPARRNISWRENQAANKTTEFYSGLALKTALGITLIVGAMAVGRISYEALEYTGAYISDTKESINTLFETPNRDSNYYTQGLDHIVREK